jgi:hypothetical protein
LIDTHSKSRTALIQGIENDESINHQVHLTTYVEDSDNISVAMSKTKIFVGANLCNNEKKIDNRSCVLIGSILMKIKEPKDHVRVPKALITVSFVEVFSSKGGATIVPTVLTATTHPSSIVWDRDQARAAWVHLGYMRGFPPSDRGVYMVLLVEDF